MQPELNDLQPGLKGEVKTVVSKENTAITYGSGDIDVFATPALVALVESAAMKAISGHLPEGWTTVGMEIRLKHFAPTPLKMEVTGSAVLEDIVGRRLVFSVQAHDEKEQVASGQHHRFIVNSERFKEQSQKQTEGE